MKYFVLLAFVMLAATGIADAHVQSIYHGGTYFGDVIVEPGQVVDGNLNVVFGDAVVEGTVNGDVNVVGGTAEARSGGTITGQVHSLGGAVARSIVPWAPNDAVQEAVHQDYRVMWRVAWDIVVVVFFLIFPLRTRMALGRLEQHPGLAVATGLLGWVAVIPVAILLAVTILLIPLIPVEGVALIAALFIGKAALALLVGRRLYEMIQPANTPSPLLALIIGLVLITAAELVPVVGALVTVLVGLVGLGAVLLSFINPPVATLASRPPMSGPPMPVG